MPTDTTLQTYARQFRAHLRRATTDRKFMALLLRAGNISSGDRIVEGGLPVSEKALSVLERLAAAVRLALAEEREERSPDQRRSPRPANLDLFGRKAPS